MSLEDLQFDIPCSVPWESMSGGKRVRFCSQCHRHVYNLSAMTRAEAEAFVLEKEGTACVQFYKRADGTALTADCGGPSARPVQRLAGSPRRPTPLT
jgi:hypothetical protein